MKLPQIQYRRVGAPRSKGPESALVKHRGRQQILSAVNELTAAVGDQYSEYSTNKTNADYADRISAVKTEMASVEGVTGKQIREWNLAGRVQDKEEGADRDFIPRHEWYTLRLQDTMDESKNELAKQIKSRKHRQAWVKHADNANRDELERSLISSAKDAQRYHREEVTNDVKSALQARNYQRALDLVDSDVFDAQPSAQADLRGEIMRSREREPIEMALLSNDPEMIDEAMDHMVSDDFTENTNITVKEQRTLMGALASRQKAAAASEVAAFKAESGEQTKDMLTRLVNGGSVAEVTAIEEQLTKEDYKYLMGQALTLNDPTVAKFVTPVEVKTQMQVQMMRLDSGAYEGEYFDEIDKLQTWVMNTAYQTNPETGEATIGIAGSDVNVWRKQLELLEAKPYKTGRDVNTSYANTYRELELRILRGSSEMMGLGNLDADSANLFSEATESLRDFVEENGGPKADVSTWKRDNLPYYLTENSKLSFYKLPLSTRDSAILNDRGVDVTKTRESLSEVLRSSPDEEGKAEARRSITAFDTWVTGAGQYYAN